MNRKERRAAGKSRPRASGAGPRTGGAGASAQAAVEDRLRRAFAAHQGGRLAEAAQLYLEVLALVPEQPIALLHLGLARWQAGQQAEGRRLVERSVAVAPDYPEAHYNLSHILRAEGDLDGAEAALRSVLRLKPDSLDALINLGALLSQRGDHAGALEAARQAVTLAPAHPQAQYNLGASRKALGDLEGAAHAYETALARQPDFLPALFNLANVRHDLGAFAQAETLYRRVLSLDAKHAEAHTGLAMTLLLTGRLQDGWIHYERRWQTKGFPEKVPPSQQDRWQGEALEGRSILLAGEQGLGDMIQFARFAAPVAARGGRVLLRCHRKLAPLLATVPGVAETVAAGDPLPAHDVWAPLMSLPQILGTDLDSIPAEVPYISPPNLAQGAAAPFELPPPDGRHPDGRHPEGRRPDRCQRIGIVWAGSAENPNDRKRSCPLELFLPLARRPDVQLYSLQVGAPADALTALPGDVAIHDLGPATRDFTDCARALQALDLLITVDTAPAHLAGALGRPAWLLLPAVPDWRWLLARDDSPWYPSLRLFRQRRSGDWGDVITSVSAALDKLAPAG